MKNSMGLDKQKKDNPFLMMIFSWSAWNWKIWYITIFVSEDIIKNKIEYISNKYNYFDFYQFFPFLGYIFNWVIMPLILTWGIIKLLKIIQENKIKKNNREWDKEYTKIININENIINYLNNLIYENYGFTKVKHSGDNWYGFPVEFEKKFILLELIEKTNDIGDDIKKGNSYKITEKGKYFLKKSTLV